MFMNKRADQNATAVYRFYSKDGEVDMTGSFLSSQNLKEVDMGVIEEDYTGSDEFVFEMDVTFYGENEDGNVVSRFSYEQKSFELERSDYMLEISSTVQAGQPITFTV